MSTMENITEDEAELYDRQIRLWGLDAQRRLRSATVLLIGLKGLGAEVAKNIILSGIKAITLMDPNEVDEEDQMSQFFISTSPLGQNRATASRAAAQLLNPMVAVSADTSDPNTKGDDFFTTFDVICATGCSPSLQCRLDNLCFRNNIKFFCGDVFGFYGYSFTDLGSHDYVQEEKKRKAVSDAGAGDSSSKGFEEEIIVSKETMVFTRLEEELSFNWSEDTPEMKKKLRKTPTAFFITRVFAEFQEQHGRRPLTSSLEADTEELGNLRVAVLNKLGAPHKMVPEDFAQFGFGELSPVCAVVGGVLAQEVIKAVSQKDAPLNNFFFYNGTNDDGMVDKISL